MSNVMPVIFDETPWEERNLGLKSFALNEACLARLDQQLLAQELDCLQQSFGKFFVFARLPKTFLHLVPCLQQCGFYLVEGAVCPVIQLHKSAVLQAFDEDRSQFVPNRFRHNNIRFITLDNRRNETVETVSAIARESFSSDRFHVDFQCPEELANRRFELWICDLLQHEDVIFDIVEVNGEAAGFMARKNNHLIIAGFSRKYVRAGLGDYLWLGSLQHMRDNGLRYAETLVSTNNIPSLNLHARLGFKFRNPQYSFHLWQQ
ncbi:MAG: GNAT family N-acetyltransferase [Mariprofundus sp.]|nr:GNAT family N-acetyltransferase [Mariprofundus sp.]